MEPVVVRVFLLPAQENWRAGGLYREDDLVILPVAILCRARRRMENLSADTLLLSVRLCVLLSCVNHWKTSRLGVANAEDNKK
jgi:hypothetical protein